MAHHRTANSEISLTAVLLFISAESHAARVQTFTTDTGYWFAAPAIERHHRDNGIIVDSADPTGASS
jgi:hypothetical protein